MEKKRALIKTRIYNYCISYALLTQRKYHAAKPKSRPIAAIRDGGVGLPGTGSPRKTLAFERCMQQEIAAYQRLISSEGSRPKATAQPVPARHSAPPPRLFSLGRDLPLVREKWVERLA